MFKDCKIVVMQEDRITFLKVMDTLSKTLGYCVDGGQLPYSQDPQRHRYKLIVSFDEEKVTYEKAVKPLESEVTE
jgi:hypothetical protein